MTFEIVIIEQMWDSKGISYFQSMTKHFRLDIGRNQQIHAKVKKRYTLQGWKPVNMSYNGLRTNPLFESLHQVSISVLRPFSWKPAHRHFILLK